MGGWDAEIGEVGGLDPDRQMPSARTRNCLAIEKEGGGVEGVCGLMVMRGLRWWDAGMLRLGWGG